MEKMTAYHGLEPHHVPLGYDLQMGGIAHQDATEKAKEIVQKCRQCGETLEEWVVRTIETCAPLLIYTKEDHKYWASLDEAIRSKVLWDVTFWETEISRSVRQYIGEISNSLHQLNLLNPPLKSEEIEPYLDEILTDRRQTLTAIDPLNKIVSGLAKIRESIYAEELSGNIKI